MVSNNDVNKKPNSNNPQNSIGIYGTSGLLSSIGPLTNGQLIIGSTGLNPTAALLTSTANTLTITPGAGSIDISVATKLFNTSEFSAYKNGTTANATGDGTNVVVSCNTALYNVGSNYNTGTYTYTAPSTGIYYFSGSCGITPLTSSYDSYVLSLVTSNRTYNLNLIAPGVIRNVADVNSYEGNGNTLADMDTNDTAYLLVTVSGSTKSLTIKGQGLPTVFTIFTGWLLA